MAELVPLIINIRHKAFVKEGRLFIKGTCLTGFKGTNEVMNTSKVSIGTAGDRYFFDVDFKVKKGVRGPKGFSLNSYTMSAPLDRVLALDVQNKIFVYYHDSEEYYSPGTMYYEAADKRSGKGKTSEVFMQDGKSVFLRQTRSNTVYLTVRPSDRYDTKEGRAEVKKAYERAKKLGPSDMILMFEKDSERYEESASVLFERLIDDGYENVYYILDKKGPAYERVAEKYRPFIIQKDSFDHLVSFFRCSKFVGTETIGHALSLRSSDRRIIEKVQDESLTHVFLQHGVMYMISLDSEMRAEFRNIEREKYRTVVSSQKEADHFIELGGFAPEELYITGLAKFDTAYRNEGADKIMIMPTWRRWEVNEAEKDFEQTGYFRLLEEIAEAVPDELKEKLVILPHPLMRKYADGCGLSKYFAPEDASYDEMLRDCALLITDYSSISYDAFYRGASVIFCWQDLERCLEHYGGAHLMIDESTAFGDVCRSQDEITESIRKNYLQTRPEEYITRYGDIVSFNDGKNTERIIEKMKEDGIL